jgi:hypothetical protein
MIPQRTPLEDIPGCPLGFPLKCPPGLSSGCVILGCSPGCPQGYPPGGVPQRVLQSTFRGVLQGVLQGGNLPILFILFTALKQRHCWLLHQGLQGIVIEKSEYVRFYIKKIHDNMLSLSVHNTMLSADNTMLSADDVDNIVFQLQT